MNLPWWMSTRVIKKSSGALAFYFDISAQHNPSTMENKQEQPQQVKVRKNWPLHRAVQEGDLSKVSDLLADTTTDVNARNVDKETALQLACALYADAPKIFGPIIKALVKAKADPNKRDVVQGL
jgi:ankyrin repeat protein